MSRRSIALLVALAAIWGASFMFIKVADRQFAPLTLVWLRLALSAAVLVPVVLVVVGRRAVSEARANATRLTLLGLVNSIVPFALIAWAETRIDSGLAAILQAAAPLFSVVIATRVGADRATHAQLLGVGAGFVGVALLVGAHFRGGHLAAFAVILAALFYAAGAVYVGHQFGATEPLVVAAGSLASGALITAPFGLAQLPESLPGWKEIGSVVVLGVVGTGVAYVLYFELIRDAGPSRSILVTYLVPPVALAYGVLLLGEPYRVVALLGLVLILGGVAFAARRGVKAVPASSRSDRDMTGHGRDALEPAADGGIGRELEAPFPGDMRVRIEGDVGE